MTKNIAYINSEMLLWARKYADIPLDYVALKTKYSQDKIADWERGEDNPTINQAKTLANLYKVPFATFFLPDPPKVKKPKHIDYRKKEFARSTEGEFRLSLEIRRAVNRRETYLELLEVLDESIPEFNYTISQTADYKEVAELIRDLLKIDYNSQKTWRKEDAFNYLRHNIENIGILVFQVMDLPVSMMRGMAIYEETLPIIIVNRKDDLKARCFSLIHELVHIFLRTSSICDFTEYSNKTEIYCNKIAGECLVPERLFKKEALVKVNTQLNDWSADDIAELAGRYTVSREVILRRLLDLEKIDKHFYESRQSEYYQQYLESKKARLEAKSSPIKRNMPVEIVSTQGRPFVRAIFQAFNSDLITGADVSAILNIKTRHFPGIAEVIYK